MKAAKAMNMGIEFGVIRGIVLDAVGTLIDPCPSVADAYAEAARRQGVVLDRVEVRDRFRRHFGEDEVDDLRGPLATDEAVERHRWRRIVAGVLPEVADPALAFEQLWDHFGRPGAWRAFNDVVPALRRIEALGLPVRVASNFDGRLRGVLRGLDGLAGLSDGAVISSEVGRRKPHPDFYRAACDRMGLPPDRVLCVGDDPENDSRGPRRAGLPAVLVDRDGRAHADDLPRLPGLLALAERIEEAARCSFSDGSSMPHLPPGPAGL